jgi:hypothetical protein
MTVVNPLVHGATELILAEGEGSVRLTSCFVKNKKNVVLKAADFIRR